jgi:hypothetical protein
MMLLVLFFFKYLIKENVKINLGYLFHKKKIFHKQVPTNPEKCIPYLPGKFAKLWFQSIPYPNILIPLANWTVCMLPY